jgi:hypothetical protein
MIFEKIDGFVVDKTTANDVMEACGSPSLHRGNHVWIYSGCVSEEIAFRAVELKNNASFRLTFDDKGILKKIEKIINKRRSSKDSQQIDEEVTDLTTEKQAELIARSAM